MASTGEERVNEIQQDLDCPHCEYNLRGLLGDVVSCPECGEICDVAKLVTARWDKPWYGAPGLVDLFFPAGWMLFGSLGAAIAFIFAHPTTLAVFLAIWLGVWAWLLWCAWRVFQNAEGLYLALVSHLIFAAYILASCGIATGVVFTCKTWGDLLAAGGWILITLVLALALWPCRRVAIYVGKRCIRQYLAKQAQV